MQNEVELTIALPSKIYLEKGVSSVLIPAVRADIDIIPGRAPSVFVLDYGVIKIYGRNGDEKEKYFIKSGVADVFGNKCLVMTQKIVPYDSISPYDAKKEAERSENEDDRIFYEMILDYQRGVRRRYLRTLNIFGNKSKKETTQDESIADIRKKLEELRRRLPGQK